jgi:methylase of polypeptide subunit release factors
MLEIGCNQGEAVKALFDNAHIVQDINGLDRVIIVES